MDGIWVNKRMVLLCHSAVDNSVKELLSTVGGMKSGLAHLMGICSGEQFDALKPEVDNQVDALCKQIGTLRSQVISKLEEVEAWIDRAKTTL